MKNNSDMQKTPNSVGKNSKAAAEEPSRNVVLDDNMNKLFCCKKEAIARALVTFGININKLKADKNVEQNQFVGTLQCHLIEVIRNMEKIILAQAQEKRDNQVVNIC
jgi:hypothetical protein